MNAFESIAFDKTINAIEIVSIDVAKQSFSKFIYSALGERCSVWQNHTFTT